MSEAGFNVIQNVDIKCISQDWITVAYFKTNQNLNLFTSSFFQSLGKCYKLRTLDIAANELRIFPTEVLVYILCFFF